MELALGMVVDMVLVLVLVLKVALQEEVVEVKEVVGMILEEGMDMGVVLVVEEE